MARRPKTAKLVDNERLREYVQDRLAGAIRAPGGTPSPGPVTLEWKALHTVAITRMRCHPETRAYEIRRSAQGKTHRDIRRSVKRALARRLYRRIEAAVQVDEASAMV